MPACGRPCKQNEENRESIPSRAGDPLRFGAFRLERLYVSPLAIACIVFGCSFGGALIGVVLHSRLPDHHLDADSKDVVKLVMGLIATMAALVLSLLIASAKSSYDTQSGDLALLSANIVQLDRLLALYGPGTKEARDLLGQAVRVTYERTWSQEGVQPTNLDPAKIRGQADAFYGRIQSLSPKTDAQHLIQGKALQISEGIGQTRLLMFEQIGSSISWPFLMILVFWIAVLFLGFGLFARFNVTVTAALLIGALSVSGAIFLMLELNRPYEGLMRISDAPLRNALAQIDR